MLRRCKESYYVDWPDMVFVILINQDSMEYYWVINKNIESSFKKIYMYMGF